MGHAFSMIVADAHARWQRKFNDPTAASRIKLSTGTDEHGQKVTTDGKGGTKFNYLHFFRFGSLPKLKGKVSKIGVTLFQMNLNIWHRN